MFNMENSVIMSSVWLCSYVVYFGIGFLTDDQFFINSNNYLAPSLYYFGPLSAWWSSSLSARLSWNNTSHRLMNNARSSSSVLVVSTVFLISQFGSSMKAILMMIPSVRRTSFIYIVSRWVRLTIPRLLGWIPLKAISTSRSMGVQFLFIPH